MTVTFLVISVLLNFFGLFYIRWLIKNLTFLTTRMTEVWEMIKAYENHINEVHDLEMFYGDEHLQRLINHGSDLIEVLEDYRGLLIEEEDLGKEETKAEKE